MKLFIKPTLLFLLLGWSASIFAQTTQSVEQPRSWLAYQSELSKLWKIQNEFLQHPNSSEGGEIFKQIMFLKESYELEQIPALSNALLRKIPHLKTLHQKTQHPYFQMALQLSPNHYANDYFLCDFNADPTEWTTTAKYCLDGLKKEFSSPSEKLILLSKISYQIFWMMVALLVFYLFVYIIKFLPFTVQYYSSAFYWISPISFLFIIGMISVLILFTFGWLFFLAFFYIFLWRFPSVKEKLMLFFLLCITMMLPFTFGFPALSKQFHSSIDYDILQSTQTLQPSKIEERIAQYVNQNPKNPYAYFSLGTMSKKIGNLEMARHYFLLSKALNPTFKAVLNTANLIYEFGDPNTAIEEYKKLIAQYPNELSPYLNLSQIYTHESKYLDGEEYLNQAKKINEEKFKSLTKSLYNRKGSIRLIYEELNADDLSQQIFSKGEVFYFQFKQFFNHYFPKYSPKLFYFTLIFSALFAILFQLLTHTRNYYFLYFNREKNLESLTLIQLKDYPNAYKKFASELVFKEMVVYYASIFLPGYLPFVESQLIKSIITSSMFFFFVSGFFINLFWSSVNDGFPWTTINLTMAIFIFLLNLIDVRIHYGKKTN